MTALMADKRICILYYNEPVPTIFLVEIEKELRYWPQLFSLIHAEDGT